MERIKSILAKKAPMKWLFTGDSITQGSLHCGGFKNYTEIFSERIRDEMGRKLDLILNSAISGNTTVDILNDFDWRVKEFNPNVAFLMIGMNDCCIERNVSIRDFEKNLELLITKFCENDILPVLQTCPPLIYGVAPGREEGFDNYMSIVKKLANSYKLPFVDHIPSWLEYKEKSFLLMSDAIHPNQYGHIKIAHNIFKEFGIFCKDSNTCKLFYP